MKSDVLDLDQNHQPTQVFSILSFLTPVCLILFSVWSIISVPVIKASETIKPPSEFEQPLWTMLLLWGIILAGPVFATLSVIRRERKSFFKITGLVLNMLVFGVVVFAVVVAFIADERML